MAAEILEGSDQAAVARLALFSQPATQVSVRHSEYQTYHPVSPLDSNDVISFVISGSEHFIDLRRIWLQVTFSLVKENGKALTKVTRTDTDPEDATKTIDTQDDPWVTTVNVPLWSLFKSLNVYFGTKEACSMQNYNYLMYMLSLLNYDREAKNGMLQMAGFEQERPGALDYETRLSTAFLKLHDRFKESKPVQLRGRLMGGIFSIDRFLCPFTQLRLDFHQTSDNFLTLNFEQNSYPVKRKLLDASLLVRKVDVLESLSNALEAKNRTHVYRYPYNNTFIRTLFIGAGATEMPFHELTSDHIPLRVVCGLVDSRAFNGSLEKNPYVFGTYMVTNIYLQAGGVFRF